jgi:hypothetical protein
MARQDQLRSMFSSVGKGLEIGPSHNPLMPKAAGFDVEVLDHLDAKGLRQKYSKAGLDVPTVQEVDFIATAPHDGGKIVTATTGSWLIARRCSEQVGRSC